jgi:predicted Fe-Mo cluster-binding NifX family protein
MRVAFTTSGDGLEAPLERRFGRSPKFLIYDLEKNSFEVIDNGENVEAMQGAGVQAAEKISRKEVSSLVTGHCGPKAFRVLSAAGITVYNTDEPTVAAALEALRAGKLTSADAATTEGHWV